MFDFAIFEIGGKQFKVLPNVPFEVKIKTGDKPEAKVLLISEAGKVTLGKPYVKDTIALTVMEETRGPKIHVYKFHAKANFRKHTGFRSKMTKVVASVGKKG